MDEKEFIKKCRELVVSYTNENVMKKENEGFIGDVYVVWCCKILNTNKALLSTDIPDGKYYEITYNGNKKELYVDVYNKEKNFSVPEDFDIPKSAAEYY